MHVGMILEMASENLADRTAFGSAWCWAFVR